MLIDIVTFFAFLHGGAPARPILTPTAAPIVHVRVATAPTADEYVDKVQAFYAKVNQVTAKFRQEVTNAAFGDKKTSDGMVWISKPGKMRWDYYSKPHEGKIDTKKSFISNGTYLYVVEHDNKQVFRKNLQNDLMPVAVSFLYGKGDLKAECTAAIDSTGKYGAKDDVVLALTPKKKSVQYKMLYLVVDPGNFRVKQSVIIDSQDNINHFRFYEPDFDKKVDDKWFEFNEKSVKNYRIRDADEEQQQMTPAPGAGAGSASGSAAGTGSGSGSAKTK